MPIITSMCARYKKELFEGRHDHRVGGSTFKMALYTNAANLNATTTEYTTVNEVIGAFYNAGGAVLTNIAPVIENEGAFTSFTNLIWANSTITARGCMIYSLALNTAVSVHDFGNDISSLAGNFIVAMPFGSLTQAILRLV